MHDKYNKDSNENLLGGIEPVWAPRARARAQIEIVDHANLTNTYDRPTDRPTDQTKTSPDLTVEPVSRPCPVSRPGLVPAFRARRRSRAGSWVQHALSSFRRTRGDVVKLNGPTPEHVDVVPASGVGPRSVVGGAQLELLRSRSTPPCGSASRRRPSRRGSQRTISHRRVTRGSAAQGVRHQRTRSRAFVMRVRGRRRERRSSSTRPRAGWGWSGCTTA